MIPLENVKWVLGSITPKIHESNLSLSQNHCTWTFIISKSSFNVTERVMQIFIRQADKHLQSNKDG